MLENSMIATSLFCILSFFVSQASLKLEIFSFLIPLGAAVGNVCYHTWLPHPFLTWFLYLPPLVLWRTLKLCIIPCQPFTTFSSHRRPILFVPNSCNLWTNKKQHFDYGVVCGKKYPWSSRTVLKLRMNNEFYLFTVSESAKHLSILKYLTVSYLG